MRTLIILATLFVVSISETFSQNFFNDVQVEYVKDSNENWSRLYYIQKDSIPQPAGVKFSRDEIETLGDGAIVSKEEHSGVFFVFEPRFPFAKKMNLITTRDYEMVSGTIWQNGLPTSSERIKISPLPYFLALVLIILSGVIVFKSNSTREATINSALIIGSFAISLAFNNPLWTIGISAFIGGFMTYCTLYDWVEDVTGAIVVGIVTFALSSLIGWRTAEGWGWFVGFLTLSLATMILIRIYQHKRETHKMPQNSI